MRFIIIVLVLLFVGCTKDLDVSPADPNILLAEDFYNNPNAYKQALAGVYSNLALVGANGPDESNISGLDAGTSQYGRSLWNLQVLSTDEVIWSWENDPGTAEIQRSTWAANNVLLRGLYGRAMASIAFANEFLRQTNDTKLIDREVGESLKNEITIYRAEARFLRALSYYHLLDLFGKCAFITEDDPVGGFQAPQIERTALFDFIESELLEVESILLSPRENEYGRADQAAAWMLLAKIYLNAEVYTESDRYADCLTYCQKIIDSPYELAANYKELFMADNNNNAATQEIIFPVHSDGIVTQNWGPTTLMVNGQVGAQEGNGEDFGVASGGWGGALRVPQRFSEIFMNGTYENDSRNTLIAGDRTIEIESVDDRNTGYIIGKWSNKTSDGSNGSSNSFVDTDFTMFRLGDVYLMFAEAALRSNTSLSEAVEYFNLLRQRAGNPNLISTSELTLDLLIDERLVELHWESHRRQDLIRFGKFTGNIYNWSLKGNSTIGGAIADFRKLYPIPSESLAANSNLEQNEGY
ncbi:MAG: RagB/SusD family nutrient uptake outer membrane protein [Saprospiraceae bacterium]